MLRFSALSLAAAMLSLGPLLTMATDLDHSNPFTARSLDTTLPKPLSDLTATRVGDDVYIIGGCDASEGNVFLPEIGEFICFSISDKLYKFDPVAEEFTELADMPTPRYRHASVAVNGAIIVLGGRDGDDVLISAVDVYDVDSNTWKTFTDLPAAYLTSDQAGFGDGAYAYFVGGYNQIYTAKSNLFRINVAESLVQEVLVVEDRAPMQVARGDVASIYNTANRFAIVAGGFTHDNDFCAPLGNVEKYSVEADAWTSLDDMIRPRSDKVLIELDEEHIFAIGGETQIVGHCDFEDKPEPGEKTIVLDDVEILHLDNGDWEALGDLDSGTFRFAAASYKESKQFYTFGGQVPYNATCQCFDTTDKVIVYTENEDLVADGAAQRSDDSSAPTLSVMMGAVVAISAAALALI